MNVRQNKLNSINVNKLRTSIDREIHKASNYNPTLDGLKGINNTLVEKPFLDGLVNENVNLQGQVYNYKNNSPIENQINNNNEVLNSNNIKNVVLGDQNEKIMNELDNSINNLDLKIQNINKNINKNKNNEQIKNQTNKKNNIKPVRMFNTTRTPNHENNKLDNKNVDNKGLPVNNEKILVSFRELLNRSKMNKAFICLFFIIVAFVMYIYYKC